MLTITLFKAVTVGVRDKSRRNGFLEVRNCETSVLV